MNYKLGCVIFYYKPSGFEINDYEGRVGDIDYRFSRQSLMLLGATPIEETYKCPSYYDNNNQLQDCTCGKCGKKIELPTNHHRLNSDLRRWVREVTNWINNHEREE